MVMWGSWRDSAAHTLQVRQQTAWLLGLAVVRRLRAFTGHRQSSKQLLPYMCKNLSLMATASESTKSCSNSRSDSLATVAERLRVALVPGCPGIPSSRVSRRERGRRARLPVAAAEAAAVAAAGRGPDGSLGTAAAEHRPAAASAVAAPAPCRRPGAESRCASARSRLAARQHIKKSTIARQQGPSFRVWIGHWQHADAALCQRQSVRY